MAQLLTIACLATLSACSRLDAREQPLPFPHQPHTDNQIDCTFCHQYADRERLAGLPQGELCGTCHSAMPVESEATKTLMTYVDAEDAIPWVRLYRLPQFTVFSHKRHVRADVACEACHGDIGTSQTPPVWVAPFEMEWCVSCHEQSQASTDCLACHK